MMKARELKVGEWVEYQRHPVSVVEIDVANDRATVWDAQNNCHSSVSIQDLKDDPQCHCDSHHYY